MGSIINSTVVYNCDIGYDLSEPQSVRCLGDGSWSNPPTCTGVHVYGVCYFTVTLLTSCFSFNHTK